MLSGLKKVLIISTDPAHNLSDSFDQKFTNAPTLVEGTKNLYGMEIDPSNYFRDLPLESVFGIETTESTKNVIQEIMKSIPGIDEATSFGEVMKLVSTLDFDTIIFDTAPTGHTLRFLNLPNILEKGLEQLVLLKEKFGGIIKNVKQNTFNKWFSFHQCLILMHLKTFPIKFLILWSH